MQGADVKWAAALLLCVGCGYDFTPYPVQCHLPDATQVHATESEACTRAAVWQQIVLARLEEFQLPTAGSERMTLAVDTRVFWDSPIGLSNGDYTPALDVMHISVDGSALLHESFHRLEEKAGRDPYSHDAWDGLGYSAALVGWESKAWPALTAAAGAAPTAPVSNPGG